MYISPSQINNIKRACEMIQDASDYAIAVQRWFDSRTNADTANADAAASTLCHAIWNACDALQVFLEINPDYDTERA